MRIHRGAANDRLEARPAAVLARRCERKLIAAARATRTSTRRRIRHAAQAFVRRHAHDRAYLAWVIQRVAANTALAAALLGLSPGISSARGLPVFDAAILNPLAALDVGGFSAPAVGDLDGDGDFDIVASEPFSYGSTRYYENVGSSQNPTFLERSGPANPFVGVPGSWAPILALGDIDSDGDLDLLIGDGYGGPTLFFRNEGSRTSPFFVDRTFTANPAFSVRARRSAPTLADYDSDGDLDIVIGWRSGGFRTFENVGSATNPQYQEVTGSQDPLQGLSVGPDFSYSAPAFVDVDGDGDLDLVAGDEPTGEFHFYENIGTTDVPRFVARLKKSNPFFGESVLANSTPTFVDIDADGDQDLISGRYGGGLSVYLNKTGQFVPSDDINDASLPAGTIQFYPFADFDGDGDLSVVVSLSTGLCTVADNAGSAIDPSFVVSSLPNWSTSCSTNDFPARGVDFDLDGDLDVLTGTRLQINTGTRTSPTFGPEIPLIPLPVPTPPFRIPFFPTFGDMDGDADLDAAVPFYDPFNSTHGSFTFFENTGTLNAPSFIEASPANVPFPDSVPGIGAFPDIPRFVADLDADGDMDVLEGQYTPIGFPTASSRYWENVGTPSAPDWLLRPPNDLRNPFRDYSVLQIPGVTAFLPITFGDLDGDGDADGSGSVLVANPGSQTRVFLENSLVRPAPRFSQALSTDPVETFSSIGFVASPAIADLDADGDLDLVIAEAYSPPNFLHYVENTGGPTQPALVERTGVANPFDGFANPSLGVARIALGDLDGDRDFDLISMSADGVGTPARFFENDGTAESPKFSERFVEENPVDSVVVGFRPAPALGDLDRDGDLDLVVGAGSGTIRYFENAGDAEAPGFMERTGVSNPFTGVGTLASFVMPALCDVDLDGDLDLIAAEYDALSLKYFENSGTVNAPSFVERLGSANPLNGIETDNLPGLACGDLRADGAPDLIVGRTDGTLDALNVPEPAQGLLLAAGVSLLAWLRRRKG